MARSLLRPTCRGTRRSTTTCSTMAATSRTPHPSASSATTRCRCAPETMGMALKARSPHVLQVHDRLEWVLRHVGLIGVRLRRGDLLAERLRPEVGVGPLLLRPEAHSLGERDLQHSIRQGAKARREPESRGQRGGGWLDVSAILTARTGMPTTAYTWATPAGFWLTRADCIGPVHTACNLTAAAVSSGSILPRSPRRPRASSETAATPQSMIPVRRTWT